MNTEYSKSGVVLIEEMAALTGLPMEWVRPELTRLVEKSGLCPEKLTLDELRPVLMQFLAEMVLAAEERQPMSLTH